MFTRNGQSLGSGVEPLPKGDRKQPKKRASKRVSKKTSSESNKSDGTLVADVKTGDD